LTSLAAARATNWRRITLRELAVMVVVLAKVGNRKRH
jgi:hypothetical protein